MPRVSTPPPDAAVLDAALSTGSRAGAAVPSASATRSATVERTEAATLRELRRAMALVDASDEARTLRALAPREVEIESPLAEWLYAHWWATAPEPVAHESAHTLTAPEAIARVGLLETARRRAAGITTGWIVLAVSDDWLTAVASRRPVAAPARHVRIAADRVVASSRPGHVPAPGDLVTVANGSSGWDRGAGWWWAHSGDGIPDGPLDRWYVHSPSAEASARLLAPLLAAFAAAGSGFSLKCLPASAGHGRPDALVAYTPRPLRARVGAELRRRRREIEPLVHASVPPTTRRVTVGIGLSEDPGDGTSFGQRRTAQVAAIAARVSTDASEHDVREASGAVGIDVAHPWKAGR